MKNMTAGQLTQIYTIATQQGCGQDEIQFLIESGYVADFFAGRWQEVNRTDFRRLGCLAPEDFGVKPEFRIFCTIKLGTGITDACGFRVAINHADRSIENTANDILDSPAFKVAYMEVKVSLVFTSVRKLGFKEGAAWFDIYKRAFELGMAMCPSEVGPQLCLQYLDQPKGEELIIVMEPITSNDHPYVFCVKRNGDGMRWLTTRNCNPDSRLKANQLLVFVRRH